MEGTSREHNLNSCWKEKENTQNMLHNTHIFMTVYIFVVNDVLFLF